MGAANPLTAAIQRFGTAQASKAYASAVDKNGNINQKKLSAGTSGGLQADKATIALNYAAEGYVGRGGDLQKGIQMLMEDLNSGDPQRKLAAEIALTYATHKNNGGNYNRNKAASILKGAGVQNVQANDVSLISGVLAAGRAGQLTPDVATAFRATADKQNNLQQEYAAVQAGNLGVNGNGQAAGGGGKGNAGNAGTGNKAGNAGNSGKNKGKEGGGLPVAAPAAVKPAAAPSPAPAAGSPSVASPTPAASPSPLAAGAQGQYQPLIDMINDLIKRLTAAMPGGASAMAGILPSSANSLASAASPASSATAAGSAATPAAAPGASAAAAKPATAGAGGY